MLELKQTFNFSQATLITPIHCKKKPCRLLESAIISKTNDKKQRRGFYQISPNADIMLRVNNIRIENG